MVATVSEKNKPKNKELVKQKLREKKKQSKLILKEKRARLIVKNLPFKTTEENLKEHFEKYGEVSEVELLKKTDGKLVGCGFIQFKLVQKAAKAKHHTNGKPFLGREILVDFSKPKSKYKKSTEAEKQSEVKEENTAAIKNEDNDNKEEVIKIEDEVSDQEHESQENSDSDSDAVVNSDSDNDVADEEPVKEERKPHVISNDVNEGRTIFVKNVPFQVTNEDLRQCMMQFGPIFYALICMDKLTEHSKGTAFVKFVNKEDAEKALNAGTELTLMGNVLDCHPALGRDEVQQKNLREKQEKSSPKDSRNLYLVKEGVILASTKAAEGVSASDMAKRLQIEQYKTQMLRNLNMFVSPQRLVIYNLPSSWDDDKLRSLLQKHGGAGSVIKEARIMRDMRDVDAKGVGRSKEYGFVSFTRHENALMALRSLNNNPKVFSENKRPIVTFSIENRNMLKARERRLEKSRENNTRSGPVVHRTPSDNNRQFSRKRKLNEDENHNSNHQGNYVGVTAKPGVKQKLRSRYKLRVQAKLHHENLKKEKKKRKTMKKSLQEKKKDFIKQPKQKINKKTKPDNFSKLVNDYKQRLISGAQVAKKSKWYE